MLPGEYWPLPDPSRCCESHIAPITANEHPAAIRHGLLSWHSWFVLGYERAQGRDRSSSSTYLFSPAMFASDVQRKRTGSSICHGMDPNKDWFFFRSSNSGINASIEHPASGFCIGPLLYACDFFQTPQDPAIFSLAIRSNGSFVGHQGLVISWPDLFRHPCIKQVVLGWCSYYMRVTFFWLITNLWKGAK